MTCLLSQGSKIRGSPPVKHALARVSDVQQRSTLHDKAEKAISCMAERCPGPPGMFSQAHAQELCRRALDASVGNDA